MKPSAARRRSVRQANSPQSLGSGVAAAAQPAAASAAASPRQAPPPPRHASTHSDSGTARPNMLVAACGEVSDLPLWNIYSVILSRMITRATVTPAAEARGSSSTDTTAAKKRQKALSKAGYTWTAQAVTQ